MVTLLFRKLIIRPASKTSDQLRSSGRPGIIGGQLTQGYTLLGRLPWAIVLEGLQPSQCFKKRGSSHLPLGRKDAEPKRQQIKGKRWRDVLVGLQLPGPLAGRNIGVFIKGLWPAYFICVHLSQGVSPYGRLPQAKFMQTFSLLGFNISNRIKNPYLTNRPRSLRSRLRASGKQPFQVKVD